MNKSTIKMSLIFKGIKGFLALVIGVALIAAGIEVGSDIPALYVAGATAILVGLADLVEMTLLAIAKRHALKIAKYGKTQAQIAKELHKEKVAMDKTIAKLKKSKEKAEIKKGKRAGKIQSRQDAIIAKSEKMIQVERENKAKVDEAIRTATGAAEAAKAEKEARKLSRK